MNLSLLGGRFFPLFLFPLCIFRKCDGCVSPYRQFYLGLKAMATGGSR